MDITLINIDGVWGSGKTTTALVLYRHLVQCGINVRIFHEEDEQISALWENLSRDRSGNNLSVDSWAHFSEELEGGGGVALMENAFLNGPVISLLRACLKSLLTCKSYIFNDTSRF